MAAYLAVLFGFLFVLFAVLIALHPESAAFLDTAGNHLVAPLQQGIILLFFIAITNLGSTTGIIAGVCVVIYVFRHRPDVVTRLVIAVSGASISAEFIKTLVHRVRPDALPGLARIASFSFPSGHSNASMVLYGFLALLLYMHAPTRARKEIGLAACAAVIVLVGLSRVVLEYHYVSDVLGGYLLGLFWLCLSLSIPLSFRLYHLNPNQSEPLDRPLL